METPVGIMKAIQLSAYFRLPPATAANFVFEADIDMSWTALLSVAMVIKTFILFVII
jgi:hypothetical protein